MIHYDRYPIPAFTRSATWPKFRPQTHHRIDSRNPSRGVKIRWATSAHLQWICAQAMSRASSCSESANPVSARASNFTEPRARQSQEFTPRVTVDSEKRCVPQQSSVGASCADADTCYRSRGQHFHILEQSLFKTIYVEDVQPWMQSTHYMPSAIMLFIARAVNVKDQHKQAVGAACTQNQTGAIKTALHKNFVKKAGKKIPYLKAPNWKGIGNRFATSATSNSSQRFKNLLAPQSDQFPVALSIALAF
eukprot:7072-Heterococcus_DN1.PRE.1